MFASEDKSFLREFYSRPAARSITGPEQLSPARLCLLVTSGVLITCLFCFHSAAAQTGTQQEREILRVESWFTARSLSDIHSALESLRPKAVSDSEKSLLMRDLPLVNAHNRVNDSQQLAQLFGRLESTLKQYGRDRVVDLIVFSHPQPIVYCKPGIVLVISTETLKIIGDDDAALVGVVAHELAHEYVALEFLYATQSKDLSRIRELELFCDAVSVVVMLRLGFDPSRYAEVLKRIATRSVAAARLNNGSNSHPSVEARLRVISDISKLGRTGTQR